MSIQRLTKNQILQYTPLTVSKNDAYASTCSRSCDTVGSCFEQARKLDMNAGKRGLLKSITIRANNKVLLERNYRNKR